MCIYYFIISETVFAMVIYNAAGLKMGIYCDRAYEFKAFFLHISAYSD